MQQTNQFIISIILGFSAIQYSFSQVAIEHNIILVGEDSLKTTANSDTIFVFLKDRGAFRSGSPRHNFVAVNPSDDWIPDSIGIFSAAWGEGTKASAPFSTAFGSLTSATGVASLAAGFATTAYGDRSIALGNFTNATSANQFVIGSSNEIVDSAIFIVGIGSPFLNQLNAMTVLKTGRVGIGTNAPLDKLEVKDGNIAVINGAFIDDGTKLIVPDYVFHENYDIKSLTLVEKFINQNKHLEGIPSMHDTAGWANLSLQARDMKLLEKIEELFLHLIRQQKQIAAQEYAIQELENQLKTNSNIK